MSKFSAQRAKNQEIQGLRAQLKAYQQIVAECMAVAWGVEPEQFTPPPVELETDYSDVEITLRVQAWWKRQVENYIDKNERCRECGATFLYHPERE